MPYIRERNSRFATTIKNGRQTLPKLSATKEEAIIWCESQKLALKRGDPNFNLTKDKFADTAIAYLAQVTSVYPGGAFFSRLTICQFIIR